MKRFLVCATLMALAFPAYAQEIDRSGELIDTALSGRDGAFEVMSEFAECAGFFEAASEYAGGVEGGRALSENLKGLSNGAHLVAEYFWQVYSESPSMAVEGVKGGARLHYRSLIAGSGASSEAFSAKMAACNSINALQSTIIQEIRKSY